MKKELNNSDKLSDALGLSHKCWGAICFDNAPCSIGNFIKRVDFKKPNNLIRLLKLKRYECAQFIKTNIKSETVGNYYSHCFEYENPEESIISALANDFIIMDVDTKEFVKQQAQQIKWD